ncbi:MAG: peptidylprolyl isomerase [Tannerella sp.]|jgi:peptidyl-prolyl cis-trans isomerase A (cyclophilin A)|nr:peptidylprolyl isomerase [Tannerella sp.]
MKTITKLLAVIAAISLTGCQQKAPQVIIKTAMGDIVAEIYTDKAPVTATNFLKLTDKGVYNQGNASFYRVVRLDNQPNSPVKIEVIQGGLNERDSEAAIAHETTDKTRIRHTDGVLSMARSKPGTASSEFFICIGDQPELDFGGKRNPDGQGFAAFGKVIEGMDVVRKIQSLKDDAQYLVEKVPVLSITRVQ